jgi:hypothetical protein
VQIARDCGLNVIGIAGADKRPLVESLDAILVPFGGGVGERVREIMPDGSTQSLILRVGTVCAPWLTWSQIAATHHCR